MKTFPSGRSCSTRLLGMAILVAAAICVGLLPCNARADALNPQRSVQGKVVTPANQPVSGAIVYLSDTRTLTVESYITQQDGAYRFEQLNPNDDYKLWAQSGGIKSKTHTISSFEERSVFHVILKIAPHK